MKKSEQSPEDKWLQDWIADQDKIMVEMMGKPLEGMPLYINDEEPVRRTVAIYRLKESI